MLIGAYQNVPLYYDWERVYNLDLIREIGLKYDVFIISYYDIDLMPTLRHYLKIGCKIIIWFINIQTICQRKYERYCPLKFTKGYIDHGDYESRYLYETSLNFSSYKSLKLSKPTSAPYIISPFIAQEDDVIAINAFDTGAAKLVHIVIACLAPLSINNIRYQPARHYARKLILIANELKIKISKYIIIMIASHI